MLSVLASAGLPFLAGLLSFLSPCVFPLVPVYAGYLCGRATAPVALADGPVRSPRTSPLANGIAFVAGFSAVFILFYYVFFALAVSVFTAHRTAFDVIAGGVIVVFGLQMLGVIKIAALTRELRVFHAVPRAGLAGSAALGVSFAAGWSPCLGPQLGAILTLAADHSFGGLPFMLLYCAGLAVPFLAVAVLADRGQNVIRGFNRHLNVVNIIAGWLLLVFGLLLATGRITLLAQLAPGSPFNL